MEAFRGVCSAHQRLLRTIATSTLSPCARSQQFLRRRTIDAHHVLGLRQYTTTTDLSEQEHGTERRLKHSVLDVLEERGLINQLAGDRSRVRKLLSKSGTPVGVYCGVDATAKSLHVGHMVPFMALFWMCLYGHTSISLVGGATCRIGDPTGRLTSRAALEDDTATTNINSITKQLHRLWANVAVLANHHGISSFAQSSKTQGLPGKVLNNEAWAEVGFLTLLRKLGTGFRLGPMLAKDTVRNKLKNGDGMSYAEFSYPLMQAWDWWHLYNSDDKIQVQIGGSDQYGNITAGMDAVNYMRSSEGESAEDADVLGFTVPLLTTASGEKFGKSAGNAVWLDAEMMEPFNLYQYFVSTPDADVEQLLRFLTFMPLPEIRQIMAKHQKDPGARPAQHRLALEFVSLVHGTEEAQSIQQRQKMIFTKGTSVETFFKSGVPLTTTMNAQKVWGQPLASVLLDAGLANSRSEAVRTLQQGGVYIGSRDQADQLVWTKITAEQGALQSRRITTNDAVHTRDADGSTFVLLRAGKKKVYAVLVSDD